MGCELEKRKTTATSKKKAVRPRENRDLGGRQKGEQAVGRKVENKCELPKRFEAEPLKSILTVTV